MDSTIDIESEQLLGLKEAADYVSRRFRDRRGGRRLAISTIFRWASRGLGGVRLETTMIGGTRATSVEALARFFSRLSDPSRPAAAVGSPIASSSSPRLDSGRRRRIEAAEQALDKVGI